MLRDDGKNTRTSTARRDFGKTQRVGTRRYYWRWQRRGWLLRPASEQTASVRIIERDRDLR
jgi:hypothetical protein